MEKLWATSVERHEKTIDLKILFISDRYPPNSYGGAELSVREIVRALMLVEGVDVEVLSFDGSIDYYYKFCSDGVVRYIYPAPHDIHFFSPVFRGTWRFVNLLPLKFRALLGLGRYVVERSPVGFKTRLSIAMWTAYNEMRGYPYRFYFDRDVVRRYSGFQLERIVRRGGYDLIHCDNLRSILRFSEIKSIVPAVALVRDLKFFCSRTHNIGRTGKQLCKTCNFQCRNEYKQPWRGFYLNTLQEIHRYRVTALKQFKKIITTSRFLANGLSELGIAANVIPNPVGNLDRIKKIRQKVVGRLDHTDSFQTLLIVGMLNHDKGADQILPVLKNLLHKHPKLRMKVIGRPEARFLSRFKKKVLELEIEEKVIIEDYRPHDEVLSEMAKATVVVCPTRWPEPFGRVPLEAMAMGRPVVAPAIGGFQETIISGRTGMLYQHDDLGDLERKLDLLLKDEKLRASIGAMGYQHVCKNYSPSKIAEKLVGLYRQML